MFEEECATCLMVRRALVIITSGMERLGLV